MDLDIRHYLTKAKEQHDFGALQSAYSLIKNTTAAGTSGRPSRLALELYVVCAEAALQLGCLEISTVCLKMYFERNPPANQFLCRAYLCQGQLKTPPATGSVEDFEEAVLDFLKAIEISKSEPRYYFIVFNASVLYFQTVRPLLQPGRCHHLVPSLRQVVQSLEEVADQDHSWRAELMMHLIKCIVDSGKTEDAARFAKVTEEFIKSHTPHLFPRLFTLLVHHKLTESDVLIEMSRQSPTLAVIYKIQDFKHRLEEINEDEPTKAELAHIFHLLVDCAEVSATPVNSSPLQRPTPIEPADRVAFLLELALLALQMKHQKVAANCLKELKSVGDASVGQRIIMECVNCEINLLKREATMDNYSKASVEARLKEIGKLDQLLQTAVSEGEPQAMQAVCATQWSFCLPLLQHNLRKRIKTPLLSVAQVLEDMQSMLLEMRCQVHSELAVIEEEEGHLEASLSQLQKAMRLDNGTQRERLSSAFHLLQLRGTLYQTPSRTEDKAAMLMQQARDMQPQDKTDRRPILIAVGLLLAPDDFQMVLDADDTSKIPVGSFGSGPVAQLFAKAQHHSTSVQKMDGHLARQGDDKDNTERVKLWATLAKTARKQEMWDVCRAACRFCLLYDDGRWKISKTDKCRCSEEESCAECHDCNGSQTCVKDLLRLLAEIHFISAEATVQKLLTEGVQLNSPAVPAVETEVCVSEDDPHWVVYRDWIQALSAYATSNFLRAAELGAEIREPWVVANAAVYLWNYSSHVLVAGEYQHLLPTFQSLVEVLRKTEYTGTRVLFVLLCNAVARGLIQPLCGPYSIALPGDKSKNKAEKGMEKAASVLGFFLEPAALQDVRKALELCDYALYISNCNIPGETVPIAARKQVVATWVQIKRLLQQQIGPKMDIKDECENEDVSAMTRVLVGVEMLQCNRNPRHMEFSVPSLSTLVSMASECSWTDAVVELQVWCQLAAFCHYSKDHSLVLCCTKNALQLEEAAAKNLKTMPCVLYGLTAVNEMLSTAACLRGLSLIHESNGDLHSYREAMKVLLSSVSYAEAENPALCVAAARHYWNACLPLTQTPEERWQLKEPLEKILVALVHTNLKHANALDVEGDLQKRVLDQIHRKQGKMKGLLTLTALPLGSSKHEATVGEEDLTLRAAIYSLLLHIHIDKTDWKSALQLLDQAIREMPRTRHRIPLLKHRILVKARLDENVLMDMQKLQDEGEQCHSFMWHQVALCAGKITQQLICYQKSITSLLQSVETHWQKVSLLLEFGEWLYSHNFPKADAEHQVQWAIDILLHLETEQTGGEEEESKKMDLSSVECESQVGVRGLLFTQRLCNLKEVWRLDGLVRAHTLLAVMADKTSPEHQLNLLRAYTFVLRIWQVSMAVGCEISTEMAKTQPSQPPPSAGSKKGKDKGKGKKPSAAEDKPKPVVLDQALPSTPKDWACYVCPDQARQIFRSNSNPHCINAHSIRKQTQSLFYLNLLEKELHSLSLDHLTLPIIHLAETIAHDLLENRSLSYLYRLRIVKSCCELGLESQCPYQEKLLNLSRIQEQEQMRCHKAIAFSQERRGLQKAYIQVDEKARSGRQNRNVCTQDIWLDKAEVCLSIGLYQPARQLLAEAHMVAMELGDQKAMARSLLSLAILACEEQNYAQALILLVKAQALGGDEEFWYQLTLTKVRAVVGQRDQDAYTKVDQIIKQGCGALKLVLEQRLNRVPELTFLISSLEMRGAIECIRGLGGGEPGETLSTEVVQRLMAACDTLRECASGFSKLTCREHAAEAHVEYARGLRILANHANQIEDKQRFLLDGISQMQLAVIEQEHVVLNAQRLLPSQEEGHGLSLVPMRRLLRLRLALAEFCLAVLEEHCADKKRQALARERKTSAEIALEEFTRCTPEPNSIEQEWVSTGSTLGQVALGQLAAVSSHSLDNMETRASCLSLMGKYLILLAVQEDPIYLCALWERHKQKEPWSDPKAVSLEGEHSEEEKDRESSRREPRVISAKSAELQRRRHRAQQLLAQASKALAEAVSLCLQHKLPVSILADASLNMLECHGQSDPAVASQYLALFQSCCTVATMAGVLSSACAVTSVSQLSALLNLHRKLLLSQEERPSSMLNRVEDSLNSLSKAFNHLTIQPSHLNILAELPPNLKILLLQHSKDGSELYGAFHEMTKAPNQKGKTPQVTGILTCSRVAKVLVCPRTLLALREKTRHAILKEGCWHGDKGRVEASVEHQTFPPKNTTEEMLAPLFREIVQDMEDYLNPLLTQFDFSCLRPQAASLQDMTKTKDKEEKEPGEYVVLLADTNLLELPLEALTILQEKGLSSVSRDFSLQLLHSRLNRGEPEKVESDNKKETKGGRGTKGKGDQSQAIKVVPVNCVLPSNTFPVDTRNFKYIVDPHNEGNFEGTSLGMRIKELLETHNQHFTHLWEGFVGSNKMPRLEPLSRAKQCNAACLCLDFALSILRTSCICYIATDMIVSTPLTLVQYVSSLSEMEQLLCRCSAFIYLGMERFMANIPPAKLAALNLSECRMALLFDLVHNNASVLRQSNVDMHKSAGQFALEKPLETALLLSMAGVGCIALNQWPSTLQRNTHNMVNVLDYLLRVRQTSGQAIHALRKGDGSEIPHHKVTGSYDQLLLTDTKRDDVHHKTTLTPSAFNCILYGLPNLIVT
ncbi:cilia- and flagella-associated protein 46 isoform X3 [Micropterus dolomieu]|uniref:cilia- and flagella-associated protein 46 isoform X3 n=1 Tax=Micropterus dolomieu TaxID=147949 RepID=UPI001E8E40D8|nr:cilia- and flagella-associated protein 46 isoform X3 [Micropterus dolomieu]